MVSARTLNWAALGLLELQRVDLLHWISAISGEDYEATLQVTWSQRISKISAAEFNSILQAGRDSDCILSSKSGHGMKSGNFEVDSPRKNGDMLTDAMTNSNESLEWIELKSRHIAMCKEFCFISIRFLEGVFEFLPELSLKGAELSVVKLENMWQVLILNH